MSKNKKVLTRRLQMQWYMENPHIHMYSESTQKFMRQKLREQLRGNGPRVLLDPMPNVCHLLRDIRRDFLKCLTLCNQLMGYTPTDVNEPRMCEQWTGVQLNLSANKNIHDKTEDITTNTLLPDVQNSGPNEGFSENNTIMNTTGIPVLDDHKKTQFVTEESNVKQVQQEVVKKRRGRKPGSKNKPKTVMAKSVEGFKNSIEPIPSAVTPAASTTSQQMVTSTTNETMDQPLTYYLDANVGILTEDTQNLMFHYVNNSHETNNAINNYFNFNDYNNTNMIQTYPAISNNTDSGTLTLDQTPSVYVTPMQCIPYHELVRLPDGSFITESRLPTLSTDTNYFNVPAQSICNPNDVNNLQPIDLSLKNVSEQHTKSLQSYELNTNNTCPPLNCFQMNDISAYTIEDMQALGDYNNVTDGFLTEATNKFSSNIQQDMNSLTLIANNDYQCLSNKTSLTILDSTNLACSNTNKNVWQLADIEESIQTQLNERYTFESIDEFGTTQEVDLQMPKLTNIQTDRNATMCEYDVDTGGTDNNSDMSSIYICEVKSSVSEGSRCNETFENVSSDWERIYGYFDRGDSDENNNEEYDNAIVAKGQDSFGSIESTNIAKKENNAETLIGDILHDQKQLHELQSESSNVEQNLISTRKAYENENEKEFENAIVLNDSLTLLELDSKLNNTLDFTENLEDAISLSASSIGSFSSHRKENNIRIIDEFNETFSLKPKLNTIVPMQQSSNVESSHHIQNKDILGNYKIPNITEKSANECSTMERNICTHDSFIADAVNSNDIVSEHQIEDREIAVPFVSGVTCLPYLVDSCNSLEECALSHTLRDAEEVLRELARLPAGQLNSTYRFMLNHEKLFHSYFECFCNFYASKKQHEKLLNLTNDCALYPSGANFLQGIFTCLQKCGFNEITACQHILNHCRTQHPVFIDALVGIIMNSGDWTLFAGYLEKFAASGTYKFNIDALRVMAPIVLRTLNVYLAKVFFDCLLALRPDQIVLVNEYAELTQCLELIKGNNAG